MRNKSIISLLVGLVLFGIGIYIVYYVTSEIDFGKTAIIIKDNKDLWKFMAFVPIMVAMFSGAIAVIKGIINLKALLVMSIIINIGLITLISTANFFNFIPWNDLWGFVSIVGSYNDLMNKVVIALAIISVIQVIDIIIQIMLEKKRNTKIEEA